MSFREESACASHVIKRGLSVSIPLLSTHVSVIMICTKLAINLHIIGIHFELERETEKIHA